MIQKGNVSFGRFACSTTTSLESNRQRSNRENCLKAKTDHGLEGPELAQVEAHDKAYLVELLGAPVRTTGRLCFWVTLLKAVHPVMEERRERYWTNFCLSIDGISMLPFQSLLIPCSR